MARVTEEAIINKMADIENGITGIKRSYGFASNPSSLNNSQLPAVLHSIPEFTSDLYAHHNMHRILWVARSILFVTPRESMGGKLSSLENATIPYMMKFRLKYQEDSVIRSLLGLGLSRAYTVRGQFGGGGTLLSHNDIDYFGVVFTFDFEEVN